MKRIWPFDKNKHPCPLAFSAVIYSLKPRVCVVIKTVFHACLFQPEPFKSQFGLPGPYTFDRRRGLPCGCILDCSQPVYVARHPLLKMEHVARDIVHTYSVYCSTAINNSDILGQYTVDSLEQ